MKKPTKRLISMLITLLMVAALALACFSGCGETEEPTVSSSELGGPKLYFLTDHGEGQMYYVMLELHREPEFEGGDEPVDGKYVDFLLRCQLTENDYADWTNADAESFLRGKTYRFEQEYTEEQLAKFNELGLTVNKLHTLLNASFGIEDIMGLTAEQVQDMFERGQWDGV